MVIFCHLDNKAGCIEASKQAQFRLKAGLSPFKMQWFNADKTNSYKIHYFIKQKVISANRLRRQNQLSTSVFTSLDRYRYRHIAWSSYPENARPHEAFGDGFIKCIKNDYCADHLLTGGNRCCPVCRSWIR